jgi:DNA-binding GntR family transcriptional regulator
MAVRLRATGQGTDMVHRIVEALREEISAGALRGGSRITGEKELSAILLGQPIHAARGAADSRP